MNYNPKIGQNQRKNGTNLIENNCQNNCESSNPPFLIQTRGNKKSTEWNPNEISTLFKNFKKYGSRWTHISQFLVSKYLPSTHRSQNEIKNKFNCCIRKFTRQLNKINKSHYTKFRKQIKNQSIFRVMEASEIFCNLDQEMKLKSLAIREKILDSAQKQEELEENQSTLELINEINSFNLKTRSRKNPKQKKKKQLKIVQPQKQPILQHCERSDQQMEEQTQSNQKQHKLQKSSVISETPIQIRDINLMLDQLGEIDHIFIEEVSSCGNKNSRENSFWDNILNYDII